LTNLLLLLLLMTKLKQVGLGQGQAPIFQPEHIIDEYQFCGGWLDKSEGRVD